jgi:MFS transporter, putative metabolite transport protein
VSTLAQPGAAAPPAPAPGTGGDEGKVGRFHLRLTVLSGMGVLLEGYDFTNIAAALIFLTPYFNLSSGEVTALSISTFVGTMVGAISAGYLADRFGRRRLYLIDLWLYVIFGIVSAIAPSYAILLIARVGIGVGIGADQALSFTLVSEYAPRKRRGALTGAMMAMWAFGALVAYGLSYALSGPVGSETWRIVFGASVIPALVVLWLRRSVPETERWQQESNRGDRFGRASEWFGLKPLFAAGQVRKTMYVVLWWGLVTIGTYGVTFYTPTIFSELGFTDNKALLGGMLVGAVTLIGALAMTFSVDRVGRKTLGAVGFAGMALSLIAIAIVGTGHGFGLLVALFCAFQFAAWVGPASAITIAAPEMFPTLLRALGVGLAAAAGRIGSILGVSLFPNFTRWWGLEAASFIFAGAAALGFLVVAILGVESKGRRLEDVSDG